MMKNNSDLRSDRVRLFSCLKRHLEKFPQLVCLLLFSSRYVCLFLWWQGRDRRDNKHSLCVQPAGHLRYEQQEQVNNSYYDFLLSSPGTQPNYPILKLFIFYEVLPPVGIEILISGSKFSIIRLKSQTREKNWIRTSVGFYRHTWGPSLSTIFDILVISENSWLICRYFI